MTLADWRSLTDAYGPPLSAVEKPEHLRGWTRISDQSSQTGSEPRMPRSAPRLQKWMSNALPERQSFGDACQRLHRITKQPFGTSAGISGTHAGVMSTIDQPMGLVSFRIIEP